ncbi:hypothetical protein BKA64DRAFT_765751 [Cadophora sp. MPI-SDFR-AT-0126]|nr:hypothetical protein BKA64DRAFT_765751 [Leotiomycetes sp. MPI-SDFR-AT-0126]
MDLERNHARPRIFRDISPEIIREKAQLSYYNYFSSVQATSQPELVELTTIQGRSPGSTTLMSPEPKIEHAQESQVSICPLQKKGRAILVGGSGLGKCRHITTLDKDEDSGTLTLLFREENNDGTDTWYTDTFDHLVIATGDNSVPWVPDIKGLECWKGDLRHTSTWRSGNEFADKSEQVRVPLTSDCNVIHTQDIPSTSLNVHPTVFLHPKVVPTISSISGFTTLLSDGSVLTDIDTIIFAAGYFYTYPFLSEKYCQRQTDTASRVCTNTSSIHTLYPASHSSACQSWAAWEKCAFLVVLYWAEKITLRAVEEQRDWEAKRLAGKDPRRFHILHPHPERVFYWDELNTLAQEYLESEDNVGDELLRDFQFEWTVSLLVVGEAKKENYRIVD